MVVEALVGDVGIERELIPIEVEALDAGIEPALGLLPLDAIPEPVHTVDAPLKVGGTGHPKGTRVRECCVGHGLGDIGLDDIQRTTDAIVRGGPGVELLGCRCRLYATDVLGDLVEGRAEWGGPAVRHVGGAGLLERTQRLGVELVPGHATTEPLHARVV